MATLIVTGRIGKDAELRETTGGTQVCSWSMAYDTGYGDKKKSHWVKCALFGKRAATLTPYLTKGGLVEVIGEPVASAWVDKQSKEPRAQIEMTVLEVKLHGGGDRSGSEAPKRREAQDEMNQDIPF